ncbi:MAG: glutamine synthetase [Clostridia bacterium]|nr:glutamine synthetase [Clostridia bacterium]
MIEYNLDKMLFNIPKGNHSKEEILSILKLHKEVQFVSFVGIDIGGHDTDEKIPVKRFMEEFDEMMEHGVQTDGSSVALPIIAELNNAKVDIVPDRFVNWYVDYNYSNIQDGLPVGTLRIPSFLKHNDIEEVGSRVILKDSIEYFKKELLRLLKENPYVFKYINGIERADEIEDLVLTSATELEFWVKTPDDKADREQLTTAQVLKEQYWKRTIGPVRSALEETLIILNKYGFEVEMGHKEVGGVKAKMGNSGNYDHIMEQLEIDWKYDDAIQAADNENQVKYIVKDVFTQFGLDVTFVAKPMAGVAGSGEHTHMGLCAKLKDGRMVNLFSAEKDDFLSPVGFGALMGILKNYEVINPFVSSSNEAFERLKPGYEAPVSIVTSLGHGVKDPSRNRTVLIGLIRDRKNPLATRFELRSPNPKSNTYLVLASCYMAMMDGIKRALEEGKTPKDLEKSISKKYGEEDFYLERDREYRTEEDVYESFTGEERDRLFGQAPATVWECLSAFDKFPEKVKIFEEGGVMPPLVMKSYIAQTMSQWKTELHNRIIPQSMEYVRSCKMRHGADATDYDLKNWEEVERLRNYLGRTTLNSKCLMARVNDAVDDGDFKLASDLQKEMQDKISELTKAYLRYKNNIF